ncbi:unnamed protein product [marine sediment metagenome]|uniref:Uncharacterized protein n=1 Tax=marine sediment metagenome TaxID=412755 RepID=X1ATC7_9ZZZZ
MNLKRHLIQLMRTIKNGLGNSNGYGNCYGCYDNWQWKEYHVIQYSESSGMFPYCEECHKTLSIDRKKELADELLTKWMSGNYWGKDWVGLRIIVHNAIEAGK